MRPGARPRTRRRTRCRRVTGTRCASGLRARPVRPAAPARVGRRRDRAEDEPRSTPAESSASWFPDRYRRRTSGRIRFIRLVGLVVRPAAPGLAGLQPLPGRRPVGRLLEAVVGTAVAGRVLAAGVDHRLPVELALAHAYRRARLRPPPCPRLLHTQ